MRSNSRKLRRQKECRSQIGTRRMSDRDCRSDSSRPHLLTARTHGGVVSVTSRRGVSARCLRGLMLALGSPIVKPVRAKSSGSSQGHSQHTARFQRFRALKPRHQQLHALRGAVDSGICQVTAPPLVNRQGATDPPHSRSRLRATSIRRRGSTIIMRKPPHRHPRLSRRPCRWTARPGKRARLRGSRFGLTSAFRLPAAKQ